MLQYVHKIKYDLKKSVIKKCQIVCVMCSVQCVCVSVKCVLCVGAMCFVHVLVCNLFCARGCLSV